MDGPLPGKSWFLASTDSPCLDQWQLTVPMDAYDWVRVKPASGKS